MLGDHGQMLSFLCLLDLVENKYWEYSHKPFKESNKKAFTDVVNAIFSNDMQQNLKQARDKWNKMKKIYETNKKKT
jgi:DNA polymerase IIIc chi subunit